MAVNPDACDCLSVPTRIHDCDRMIVPTGHVSLDYIATLMDHDDRVRIDMRIEIDAREFAFASQIFNDAEAVTKIVGNEECVSVGTDRESARIDWRAIAVVKRGVGRSRETTHVDERRFRSEE